MAWSTYVVSGVFCLFIAVLISNLTDVARRLNDPLSELTPLEREYYEVALRSGDGGGGSRAMKMKLIRPLWRHGQRYSLLCFLSESSRMPSSFNVTQLRQDKALLVEKKDLVYDADTLTSKSSYIDLEIISMQEEKERRLLGKRTSNNNNGGVGGGVISSVASASLWHKLQHNSSSIYLHIAILTDAEVEVVTQQMVQQGRVLYAAIHMIKRDALPRSFRARYLLSDVLGETWADKLDTQRNALAANKQQQHAFWKPEVCVRLVCDWTVYPRELFPQEFKTTMTAGGGGEKYMPAIYADELGLTSDRYVALNASVNVLPLRISYQGMSLARWMMLMHLEESLAQQKELGFSQKDLDDVRHLLADTQTWLLGVTIFASLLHCLFEFLAFKSDIAFWAKAGSLGGLSLRAVVIDLVSQFVVFLFLIDQDTSLLVLVPAGLGVCIQAWKAHRAWSVSTTIKGQEQQQQPQQQPQQQQQQELERVSLEADAFATRHMMLFFGPLLLGVAAKSLVFDKHTGWYSWILSSVVSGVYAFGFALMTPQLYINWKLKSVSHLPWTYLCYKATNTFIDDLFAFVIKMPTMHRVACFRDDIVFGVYVWQRWTYSVDNERPMEK